jgi:hypothetical protein
MAIIDSLVAKLSFDFDDEALKKFDKGMKDAAKVVAVVATGAAAAGAAIFAFTSKIAEQNDELGKTAQIIGITSQAINELGFVAELNGGSVDSMSNSLENIAKTSSEAARGLGAGVEAFGLLGISTTDVSGNLKKADELLLNVADSISQLDSQSQKLELLNKLGIDSNLLLTLEQGSAAIRAQRKEVEELGFVLDQDATASAAKFNDEMLRVKTVVAGVSSAIGTKLMKQITPMIETFLKWFKANKEIIKQNLGSFFEKLVKVINVLFNIGRRVVNVVDSIVQSFGGWANAIGVVSAALLAMNVRILLIPALILAAGAAMFLLIEDLVAFANGADSQIGSLTKKSDGFRIVMESLVEVLAMVGEGWGLIFSDGEAAFEGLIIIIKDIGQAIADFIMAPINAVTDAFESLKNKTSGLLGEAGDTLDKGFDTVTQFLGITETPQPAMINPSLSSGNVTNQKEINITIEGGNVEEVKQAVSEALSSEFKTTELNMSTPTRF